MNFPIPFIRNTTKVSVQRQREVIPAKGQNKNFLLSGFSDLSQDDQLILIKVGFFEIWLGHVARLTSDSTLTFSDGTYITRQQMEHMYDVSNSLNLF
jgi:hypothetical protein